ncbi:hypothetical protein GIB67_017347 [Kingdonia uniflora]|uniref:Receptor-like serine/threonine-protein kinase n=1 Tax=Kingdonia uniflora TaxID=39325 RepID=A0A7J7MPK0_9MAGN|nr:hypothetical protein GIB67_017347 [Kingdonia uniflora]
MVNVYCLAFYFSLLSFLCQQSSTATHILTSSQPLIDGNTIVSQDGTFELGFFSPGDSSNRYVGIWYKKIPIQRVVWVANRNSPLNDSLGVLKIEEDGNLVLNRGKNAVWSSNASKSMEYPVAELLDSGNFVLRDVNDGNSTSYLWESFDYPSDTLLPGMKLGWNLKTGLNRYLSSWKNYDDPSIGYLTYGIINIHGYPDSSMRSVWKEYYRSGPWNGFGYSGQAKYEFLKADFVNNEEEVYYIYKLKDKSVVSIVRLNQTNSDGAIQRITWVEPSRSWVLGKSWPQDFCDTYSICGAYSTCNIDGAPVCNCLKGFKPRSPETWNKTDYSKGCVHATPLNCTKGDEFLKLARVKLADTTNTWVNKSMNLNECRIHCMKNCSCMAYTNYNISGGGSGCVIWSGDLVDIRQFNNTGEYLFIRMPASQKGHSGSKTRVVEIVIVTVVTLGMLLLGLGGCFIWNTKRKSKASKSELKEIVEDKDPIVENEQDQLQLPLFDLVSIKASTNNFSDVNKLGEGGFGIVFKGTLEDGQEIAVKRLSKKSTQGNNEFMNEVILIAKLQHRNLVRLLGCCIQGEEKMLIYEYMPNKSLDFFIFDNTRCAILDWQKRFHIIVGIARGLLYLHQDSRLRIIHRDLKASNVLLDTKLEPKISDFGMAKIFEGDQIEGSTSRVVGTYGYMSPEYAIDGHFSMKSDVYSFGVLVLEIISGRKNRGFYHPDHQLNLLGHAWRHWSEDKAIKLIDKSICECDSYNLHEVLRCIHVGLLCVQQRTEDRPIMSSVLLMLGSENAILHPQRPGFFMERSPLKGNELSSSDLTSYTSNEITVTMAEGR